jgi:microcystin degradation protein MlrC
MCTLTEEMLSQATVLVGFKEYPHIDAIDRILEVFELVTHTAEGKNSAGDGAVRVSDDRSPFPPPANQ